jgi:DnaJ-class molecular chaperone
MLKNSVGLREDEEWCPKCGGAGWTRTSLCEPPKSVLWGFPWEPCETCDGTGRIKKEEAHHG